MTSSSLVYVFSLEGGELADAKWFDTIVFVDPSGAANGEQASGKKCFRYTPDDGG